MVSQSVRLQFRPKCHHYHPPLIHLGCNKFDASDPQGKSIRSEYGWKLLTQYMAVLSDPDVFVSCAECFRSDHVNSSGKGRSVTKQQQY